MGSGNTLLACEANLFLPYLCPKSAILEYTQRILESNDWATYLLVFCFLLLAATKYFYPRRFSELLMLPLSDKYFNVYGKEDSVNHPFNVLLFTVQVISASIFVFLLFKAFHPQTLEENSSLFIQVCTVYAVFVLVKVTIEKMVGNIFSMERLIDSYLFQKLSYRNVLALGVLIGNICFVYIFPITPMALGIFTLVILLLNLMALFYSYKKNGTVIAGNFFHFILYLCALEISPYIIIYYLFVTDGIF